MAIAHLASRIYALFVLILITFLTKLVSANSGSTVRYLPGFEGPLPFHLETGYVGVGDAENVQLFYYFVKSEGNPEKDPLLIWLTGGPGCSAWSGLVYEVGPLNYKVELYNGSLPTLVLNQHSWTKVSSIIFVDAPVGTGFSYPTNRLGAETGDFKQVQHLSQFLKKWLVDIHPEFLSNPFYVAGDSYSGIIVPMLVQEISNGIEEGTLPINLKRYVLGNPYTSSLDNNYRILFARGMALISDELNESLERSCGGEYYESIDPSNTLCMKDFQAYEKCTSMININYILEPVCTFASPKPEGTLGRRRRWLNQNDDKALVLDSPLPSFGCREYDQLLSRYWANDPSVRKALHVKEGSIGEWLRCKRDQLLYSYDVSSSFEYHVKSSAKGFRSLIYSGDHDLLVPFLATEAWIKALNYSIIDDWRPWIVQDQVGGYTRTYSNQMTFATVKGAGHTAPQYKPKECFAMFKRWIDYESL